MLDELPLEKILFIDIETVPQNEYWKNVPEPLQELWDKKTLKQRKEEYTAEEYYYERAGILAEFGKIVCISCGIIIHNKIRINSLLGEEKDILTQFKEIIESDYYKEGLLLCAHNGKEFDYPYIARRMLINQIRLPYALQFYGKKPWEVPHLDTMDLWKFGDYKHFTSLDLLAQILQIPSPKQEMSGADVQNVYYKEKNINKIKSYCEGDVQSLINIFRKLRFEPPLEKE